MNRVRVAIPLYPVQWGGLHGYYEKIDRFLAEAGLEAEYLISNHSEADRVFARMRSSEMRVRRLDMQRVRASTLRSMGWRFPGWIREEIAKLETYLQESRAEVVVVPGLHHIAPVFAANSLGVPVVWQFHSDLVPMPYRALLSVLATRNANVIMTNGITMLRRFPGVRRFARKHVAFFPPCVAADFRVDPEQRQAVRVSLGVSDDRCLIGTLGNLTPQKNHRDFVRVATAIRRQRADVAFVIFGAGDQQSSYFKRDVSPLIDAFRDEFGEDLVVRDPREQVPEALGALDIFMLTSVSEGMPLAIVEALAANCLVFSYDVGGVRELLRMAGSGETVPVGHVEQLADAVVNCADKREVELDFARNVVGHRFHPSYVALDHVRAIRAAIARR